LQIVLNETFLNHLHKGEGAMKLLQFFKKSELRLGVKTALGIFDVKEASERFQASVPCRLQELILLEDEGISKINSLVNRACEEGITELFISDEEITYASAVTNPEKIICVGLNYVNHTKEIKME
jgi:2-keto-4-pentenoate hydratase/2-oxohepta-3-ene-1,7-dioic acid hydratase in catechol pathway